MNEYLTPQIIKSALANLPQLVFEITDACNLKCKYCGYGEFYDDYDNRLDKMFPIEKAYRMIDYLADFWNSNMNVSTHNNVAISFYGGEPLLNMQFIKTVVNYIEKKVHCPSRNFTYSMTTNAILLHRYMDFLCEHRFRTLISLDGNKKNTGYRVDRSGRNAFDRIVKNVDALRDKYPEYFKRYVSFNAVLHNKNSVEEIYNFFKHKYDKTPRISELNNVGIRVDKQGEFMQTYRNASESLRQAEHYEEIERDLFINTGSYQSASLFLHQYSGYVFKDYTDLLYEKKHTTIPTGTCSPFSKKMFVTVNGKILPCERIGHHFALGEITDTEIRLDFEAIADKINTYYAKMERLCNKCKNTNSCIQCIYNLPDIEKKPVCNGYMDESAFRNYYNEQMGFLKKNPEAYKKIMEEILVY